MRNKTDTARRDALTFEQAALRLLNRGYYVIPSCWPDAAGNCGCSRGHTGRDIGKAPLVGKGYQHIRADEAQVRDWGRKWPWANISVLLEPSKLLFVGPDCDEALRLALANGLPPTMMRYSDHPAYVYARPEGCRIHRLCRRGYWDILTNGYMVACGQHRTGADIYLTDDDPAPAPDWAVQLLAVDASPNGHQPDADEDLFSPEQWKTLWAKCPRLGELEAEQADEGLDYEVWRRLSGLVRRFGEPGAEWFLKLTDAYAGEPCGCTEADQRKARRWLTDDPQHMATCRSLECDPGRCGFKPFVKREEGKPDREVQPSPIRHCTPRVKVGSNGKAPERPGYPCTDLGNAERLVAGHGRQLRYCSTWGCWLAWDGRRWRRDDTGEVERRAKATVRMIYHEAGETEDKETRKALASWAKSSESKARIESMIALAQSERSIAVRPEAFDADPWLLNVANGTVNLRTGELRPHDPADMITMLAPVECDPGRLAPGWQAHVERFLPGTEIRRQVQRGLGRALVGATLDEELDIWFGSGANGKTTTARVLRRVLGDYADRAAPDLLVESKYDRHPTELADLCGKRLIFSVEVDQGKRLAEALVKELTGGDPKKARFMRGDFFTFEQTFSIVLIVNHRPIITGSDDGIWRRIRLVPWAYRIPDAERRSQEDVVGELAAEGGGILAWLLAGLRDWQQDHGWIAADVRAASDAYRAEMDVLGDFIRDCCILGPRLTVAVADLYKAYTEWCTAGGEKPAAKRSFTQRLRDRGIGERKGAKGIRLYQGIGLQVAEGGRCSVSSHEDSKTPDDTEEVPPSATQDPDSPPPGYEWYEGDVREDEEAGR